MNCGDNYWTETHVVVNRSFTRIYFNSDAGSRGIDGGGLRILGSAAALAVSTSRSLHADRIVAAYAGFTQNSKEADSALCYHR